MGNKTKESRQRDSAGSWEWAEKGGAGMRLGDTTLETQGQREEASSQKQEGSELTRVGAVRVGRKGGGQGRKEEIQDFTHTKERLTGLVIRMGGERATNHGGALDFKLMAGQVLCQACT